MGYCLSMTETKQQTELELHRIEQLKEIQCLLKNIESGYRVADMAEMLARSSVVLMSSYGCHRSAFTGILDLADTQRQVVS